MKTVQGTVIERATLNVVRDIVSRTSIDSCQNSSFGGAGALKISVSGLSYIIVIDEGVITFVLEVHAPQGGHFDLANEWNMHETVGTAFCLTTGYALKFGVVAAGGVVRETLHDAVSSFNKAAQKFANKVQAAHQQA